MKMLFKSPQIGAKSRKMRMFRRVYFAFWVYPNRGCRNVGWVDFCDGNGEAVGGYMMSVIGDIIKYLKTK